MHVDGAAKHDFKELQARRRKGARILPSKKAYSIQRRLGSVTS